MARRVKIHKRKSFMFTSKHHSFTGWLSAGIALATIVICTLMLISSFNKAGDVTGSYGGIGLSCALLNIVGIIAGITGLKERDAFITVPIIGISLNGLMTLGWIITIIISQHA